MLPLLRTLLVPVRRLGDEQFRGDSAKLLLAGNALHADVPPDAPPSGFLGWLLTSLAQDVGFPTPVGGAGELAAALVRRLERAGGRLRCGAPVERVVVEGRRAVGVEVAGTPVAPGEPCSPTSTPRCCCAGSWASTTSPTGRWPPSPATSVAGPR